MTIHVCCKCMFKCFSYFKRMLQMFYLDVEYVALDIHVCCKCMFQVFYLFQTYIATNALCCKCFMSRRGKRAQAKVVPSGAAVLACAREAKRARSTKLYSWVWQQTRSTKLHPWSDSRRGARSYIHRRPHGIILLKIIETGQVAGAGVQTDAAS
jgi:hypothetical protein